MGTADCRRPDRVLIHSNGPAHRLPSWKWPIQLTRQITGGATRKPWGAVSESCRVVIRHSDLRGASSNKNSQTLLSKNRTKLPDFALNSMRAHLVHFQGL